MKNLIILFSLLVSPLSFSVTPYDILTDPAQNEKFMTLFSYNRLRNEVAAQIPALSTDQMKQLYFDTRELKKKMKKYPDLFSKDMLADVDAFMKEVDNATLVRLNIERCDLDSKYNVTKNDLTTYSEYVALGERDPGCANLNASSYAFPEINSIKEIGVKTVQSTMATQVHRAMLDSNIQFYIDSLDKSMDQLPDAAQIQKDICKDQSKYCRDKVAEIITKRNKTNKDLLSFQDLLPKEQKKMKLSINDQVSKLNVLVNKIREKSKKDSFYTVAGRNDFLITCNDENAEDFKLYEEYKREVERLITPASRSQKDIIQTELVVTMLYDQLGKPAEPETECNEEGVREITLEEEHHDKISVDDLEEASKNVAKNARQTVIAELDDFNKGNDPIDYIGMKAAFAPHVVGKMLGKNPHTVAMICDGLKDYQQTEDAKDFTHKAVNVMVYATAFTGIGGLALKGLQGALWGAGTYGTKKGVSRLAGLENSAAHTFSAANSNLLLSSNGATLGYGAVTIAESATLQYLRLDQRKDVRALENQILSMPESKSRDNLLKAFNKAAELDWDFYLSVGLGSLDIIALKGILKTDGVLSAKQMDEATAMLNKRIDYLSEVKGNPSFDPITGLKGLLPANEYEKLMSQLSQKLPDGGGDEFVGKFRLNLENNKGDFIAALQKTVDESKMAVDVPTGNQLNRSILAEIPESQRADFVLNMTKKYDSLVKDKGFGGVTYEDDMASILYLIEKQEGFKARNLPVEQEQAIVAKRLDEAVSTHCGPKK